ncbi:hypothetical protein HMPREF1575_01387, partial [Gardnerella vaginalis JCP7672]
MACRINRVVIACANSARTSSPRRSSASDLSGSALQIAFSRYALSEK